MRTSAGWTRRRPQPRPGCARRTRPASRGCRDAIEELVAARAAVPSGVVPFDRARCLLVAGQAHRRARRKAAARDALDLAAAEFDALGARGYAARAQAEAARVGGRPATPFALT